MGSRFARTLPVLFACLGFACGEPPPPSPSAVINASPKAVCVGDDFATTILLDAKDSAPYLTLVYVAPDPDAPPLELDWSFTGSETRSIDGDKKSVELSLAMAGDRPLHVKLRVENSEGGVAEALQTIAVTPLVDGVCPLPPVEE